LIQFGYWLQQIIILVLNLEKPRKDFVELVCHHIITSILIGFSYMTNFTRVGNAVFITMDFSDIWLSVAKCFKYLRFPGMVIDGLFVLFMVIWAYTRHYLFGLIIYSTWAETCPSDNNPCIFDPWHGRWLTWYTKWIILFMMCMLEALMIHWFVLIIRIAWRVVCGKNAEDTRSDPEDDDDDINPSNPVNNKKIQ